MVRGRVLLGEERAGEPPAQPGFAARVAEKPPHPAKRAGHTGRCKIGERNHPLRHYRTPQAPQERHCDR
jgi:hypothetical protein